jgi:hypothetical protein
MKKVVYIGHGISSSELTFGKIYDLEESPRWAPNNAYFVKNDRGFISAYNKSIFLDLEEWRNAKIDKVLS